METDVRRQGLLGKNDKANTKKTGSLDRLKHLLRNLQQELRRSKLISQSSNNR